METLKDFLEKQDILEYMKGTGFKLNYNGKLCYGQITEIPDCCYVVAIKPMNGFDTIANVAGETVYLEFKK